MPWSVKASGNQFCVYKKGASSPIKGGCHSSRTDAVKHMRALYANEGKTFSEKSLYMPVKGFSADLAIEGQELPWIQIFPFGHWSHPVYGENAAVVNYERAARYVKNFNDNVRRQDIATDYEHGEDKNKGSKASGWYRGMELRDDGIYGQIEFTDNAREEIKKGEWKYFSPLFVDLYEDAETGEVFEDVIIGGALTNRPWMKDMVPINFSEAVLEEQTTKFRFKDGRWIASDNDGEGWRNATSDEVAELEHSEPGTGTPPEPRTDEDDKSGDKDGSGSRRDSPPPQDEKEGSIVLTAETLKLLGLAEDADEVAVNTTVAELFKEVEPLRKFHDENNKVKAFAEQFPEQAKEMERLRKSEDERLAKAFSERYERIVSVEGEGDDVKRVKTTKGFSGLVLNKIEEMAKAFSEGNGNLEAVKEVLDAVATDKAIVDYGETGSSRVVTDEIPTEVVAVRKAFAEKVAEIQTEEGGPDKCSWGDAIAKTVQKHPELAKAYSEARPPAA